MPARKAEMREIAEVHDYTPQDQHQSRIEEENAIPDVRLAEPVMYYNPITPHEKFRMPGTSYFVRFSSGGYEAQTEKEEDMVRRVLAGYGRDRPDRWRGDDKEKPWVCKRCGFMSKNDNAIDDHRETGL